MAGEQILTQVERELLEVFARVDLRAPDANASATPALESPAQSLVEALVARGYLRQPASGYSYVLTEAGRLAIAGRLDVTLYTRPGCHLCEEAKKQIQPLLRRAGAQLREVNIDEDPALRERYDVDVPVIFLGGRKVAKHRVDLRQFRRQLEEAAKS